MIMATTTVTTDAVRPFDALRRGDVDYAGGKGANLGEMTAAGLPVPPGFVVGAGAYAAFCDASDVRDGLAATLAGVDVDDTATLEGAATAARDIVQRAPVPSWLHDAIATAYAELCAGEGDVPVAVRSSATARTPSPRRSRG
jgi:pyruvate,water dikinase